MAAVLIDEASGTALPRTLPTHMLIAIPPDGSPPLLLGTLDRCAFDTHLERAGFDPGKCAIGQANVAGADFSIDWTRTVHVDAA